MYLIDSDILIEHFKGKQTILQRIPDVKTNTLAISVATFAEVLEGVIDNVKERKKLEDALQEFIIIPIESDIAKEFAIIRAQLRKTGNIIGNMDIFIAATARTYTLTLATNNKKDFERIEGLKLI